jgi:hypothetical protein
MQMVLRNIWCPWRGIRLGDNLFPFTFLKSAGKHRAIEDGPWDFGGDLLVVCDLMTEFCRRKWSSIHPYMGTCVQLTAGSNDQCF